MFFSDAPSSSMSMASGRAGLVSGSVSISPGLSLRTSSALGPASPGPANPSSSFSFASASSNNFWYRSKHCVAVRPTIGAIVRHCVGINFARCNSFSSSVYVTRCQRCKLAIIKDTYLRPLCLLDRRVQPFIPPCFALLRRLSNQKRRNTGPECWSQRCS